MSEQIQAQPQVMSFREAIRKRPGMYVGSLDWRGLHHLIKFMIELSIGDAQAGLGNQVELILNSDGSFVFKNNAPGLPIEPHPTQKVSWLEILMSEAWHPFNNELYNHPVIAHHTKYRIGRNWSLPIVTNLSEWAWVEVRNEETGQIYHQGYASGIAQGAVGSVEYFDQTVKTSLEIKWNNVFCFKPDPTVFDDLKFRYEWLFNYLRTVAFLTPNLHFHLLDRRDPQAIQQNTFYFPDGLATYIEKTAITGHTAFLSGFNQSLTLVHAAGIENDIKVEVAFGYENGSNSTILCYVNYEPTESHTQPPVRGFFDALRYGLNKYAQQQELLTSSQAKLSTNDLTPGLVVVISVMLKEPHYLGPTRSIGISDPETRAAVRVVFAKILNQWLDEYPTEARRLVENRLWERQYDKKRRRG